MRTNIYSENLNVRHHFGEYVVMLWTVFSSLMTAYIWLLVSRRLGNFSNTRTIYEVLKNSVSYHVSQMQSVLLLRVFR
jgi:hypothetical protein